eukprot:1279678-Amphidinium_carterae.1
MPAASFRVSFCSFEEACRIVGGMKIRRVSWKAIVRSAVDGAPACLRLFVAGAETHVGAQPWLEMCKQDNNLLGLASSLAESWLPTRGLEIHCVRLLE